MKHAVAVSLLLAASVLAGCQSTAPDAGGGDATPTPAASTGSESADSCGSAQYAWLVGQDRKQVPAAPEGKVIRVVCSTCPMTMDYNAQRLNVVFDEKTGVVQKLSCG